MDDDPDPRDVAALDKMRKPFSATVVVDTREQLPWHFLNCEPWSYVPTVTRTLVTGDYSLVGMESLVCVERKTVADFLSSVTAGRDRFEREFERMSAMSFAAVVVEAELSSLLQSIDSTRISVDSVLGTIRAWSVRYGVHFFFCPGRRFAELHTLGLLHHFCRHEQHRLAAIATDGSSLAETLKI